MRFEVSNIDTFCAYVVSSLLSLIKERLVIMTMIIFLSFFFVCFWYPKIKRANDLSHSSEYLLFKICMFLILSWLSHNWFKRKINNTYTAIIFKVFIILMYYIYIKIIIIWIGACKIWWHYRSPKIESWEALWLKDRSVINTHKMTHKTTHKYTQDDNTMNFMMSVYYI